MVIHTEADRSALQGGGMYEDKAAAIERIKATIQTILPQNVRERLVLENDEVSGH